MTPRRSGRSYDNAQIGDNAVVLQGNIYPEIVYIIVQDEYGRHRQARRRELRRHRDAQLVRPRGPRGHQQRPLLRYRPDNVAQDQSDREGYDASSESEALQDNFRHQLNGRVRRALRLPTMSNISFQTYNPGCRRRPPAAPFAQAASLRHNSPLSQRHLYKPDPLVVTMCIAAMSSFAGSSPKADAYWVFRAQYNAQDQAIVVYAGGVDFHTPALSISKSLAAPRSECMIFRDAVVLAKHVLDFLHRESGSSLHVAHSSYWQRLGDLGSYHERCDPVRWQRLRSSLASIRGDYWGDYWWELLKQLLLDMCLINASRPPLWLQGTPEVFTWHRKLSSRRPPIIPVHLVFQQMQH